MNIIQISGGVTAPKGFKASGVHCGIRKNKTKKDLALIVADNTCSAAAVYTQNLVQGAPITVTKENISDGFAKAVICNSGNANTCNSDGIEKAESMCRLAAEALGIAPSDIVIASTGVIGQTFPIEPIENGMAELVSELSYDGGADAAEAILTTDTAAKEAAVSFELDGRTCVIGGMCKGSGMIHPNMATMLGFLTTDAAISPSLLDQALHEAVALSFNMVSVDGDTSTNDMVSILASGCAGNRKITDKNENYDVFSAALTDVCIILAKKVAKDGEGATKLLECKVLGAKDELSAKAISKSVICSSLVKSAFFGADANWGRILCAIGYSGQEVNIQAVDVCLSSSAGSIKVCENGAGVPFCEETAKKILLKDEILIDITLHDGLASACAWGCDLTYDYVKINGDYRT